MKKLLPFILISLFTLDSYSQNRKIIYVDENYKEIDQERFKKKAQTDFFFVAVTSNDTAVFNKLRFRELYGKLELKEKNQIKKLFQKRYDVDTTKVLLIHYKDSLPDIKKMHEKSGFIILDSSGNEISKILTWNEYQKSKLRNRENRHLYKRVTSYESFKMEYYSERKNLRNQKDFELLHFYDFNKGYPLGNDEFDWKKDSGQILKTIFTFGMEMYKIVVLHPDGSFFAITHEDSIDRQKENMSFKSYKRSKKRWLKEYQRFN